VVLNKNENMGGSSLPNIHEKDHGYDNTSRSHSEPSSDAAVKRRGKKKSRS
jgi:hypothetical protein